MSDQPNPREELWDRITDQALEEIMSAKQPPEISAGIPQPAAKQQRVKQQSVPRRRWKAVAIAASLLLAFGLGYGVNLLGGKAWFQPKTSEQDQVVVDGSRSKRNANDPLELELDTVYHLKRQPTLGDFDIDDSADKPFEVFGQPDTPGQSERESKYDRSGKRGDRAGGGRKGGGQSAKGEKKGTGGRGESTHSESGQGAPKGAVSGSSVRGGPILNKLPYISRLFADEPIDDATRALMMKVTPRIIIQEGEEALLQDDVIVVRGWIFIPGEGRGPGDGGDRYRPIYENRFLTVHHNPLSTFSVDVDTASYAKVRRLLMQSGRMPPPDAVRIEEFVNYFSYGYAAPKDGKPFAVHTDMAPCPWQMKHKLLRIGIKGKEYADEDRPASNLVFLVDVSGSMNQPDKLPLVKRGLKTLVEQLGENDRVAIVVYANATGLVLPSTRGSDQGKILAALERLQAGGSTNGGEGIRLAYQIAADNFITGGVNRVILATDGDFNVGTTDTSELVRLVKEKAKTGVFLTVLGFGVGNHNDSMLEQIADKGNGNYAYIDTDREARKVFVEQMAGTLITIAKDVKIQVEFNPAKVAAYRLIGYENRMLKTEDFKDDAKDAGEIGAGHTVTALYEIVPAGEKLPANAAKLKYQRPSQLTPASKTGEIATVYLRYKEPEGKKSKPLEFVLKETDRAAGASAADFDFAAAVASFGMLLRNSEHRGESNFELVLELAQSGAKHDPHGYRKEFLQLVKRAKELSGGK